MSAFTDLLDPAGGRLLVVTNDFPPRVGGIQTFVRQLVGELDPSQVVVHTSSHPEAEAYDAEQPFVVVRDPSGLVTTVTLIPRRTGFRRFVGFATADKRRDRRSTGDPASARTGPHRG